MYRIDSSTAGPGGSWVGTDPITGQVPTKTTPEWQQMVQETLLAPIEDAGLSPSKADTTQLTQAIKLNQGVSSDKILNGGFAVNQRAQPLPGDWGDPTSDVIFVVDRWGLVPVTTTGLTVNWEQFFGLLDGETFTGWTDPFLPGAGINLVWNTPGPATDPILLTRLGVDRFPELTGLDSETFSGRAWFRSNSSGGGFPSGSATQAMFAEVLINYGSGGTAREVVYTSPTVAVPALDTWTQLAFTFQFPDLSSKTWGSAATEQYVEIRLRPVRAGVAINTSIADVSFYRGAAIPPRAPRSWPDELEDCRFYYRTSTGSERPGTTLGVGSFGIEYYHPRTNDFAGAGSRRLALTASTITPHVDDWIGSMRLDPHATAGRFKFWSNGTADQLGGQSVTFVGSTAPFRTGNPTLAVAINGEHQYDWEADAEFYNED